MFKDFSASDWLQFYGVLVSFLTGAIAIIISIATLRQNNRMLEESSRPVLSIYSKYVDGILYIIIKNFGRTLAKIDKVVCNHEFSLNETMHGIEGNIFDSIIGSSIAPEQKIICPFISHKLSEYKFNFYIEYHSSTHKYTDHFDIDCKADNAFPDNYTSAKNSEEACKIISRTMQGILKTKL